MTEIRLRPLVAALALLATLTAASGTDPVAAVRLDPEKTVGPDVCARCHEPEFRVWRDTAHARLHGSEVPLHRRPRAQEIARNLGVRLVLHDSLCLECHFTPTVSGGRVTAMAGVSCESCHGAARDWVSVHNTFRGRQTRRAEESAAESLERVERNVALGMHTPGRLYELLSRCYTCHLVPQEELVEAGRHTAGSSFDLADRMERIRHNFVTTGHASNAPLSAELRRKLAVLGPALELEHGLRALAAANDAEAGYARSLARRVEVARRDLSRFAHVVPLPELDRLLAATEGLRLAAGNAAELTHAVGRVAEASRSFSQGHDGSRLGALDGVLRGGPTAAEGADDMASAGAGAEAFEALLEAHSGEVAEEAAPRAGAVGRAPPAAAPAAIPAVEGERRRRVREPLSPNRVVGAYECASCHQHARQEEWWRRDPHRRSALPLLERRPRAVEIASLYYGQPAGDLMVKGGSVCMGCHGTAVTGEEVWEVEYGVSCEHCHGPAGEYLRGHQQASAAERRRQGMVGLGDPDARAEVCSGCHHVTDRRLLASGHRPGSTAFDLAERSARIVHWERSQPSAPALSAAHRRLVDARPVPQVRVAKLDPALLRSAAGGEGGGGRGATQSGPRGLTGPASGSASPDAPAPRPAGGGAAAQVTAVPTASGRDVELEPLPEDAASRPLDELLLLVKERLDELFTATGGER